MNGMLKEELFGVADRSGHQDVPTAAPRRRGRRREKGVDADLRSGGRPRRLVGGAQVQADRHQGPTGLERRPTGPATAPRQNRLSGQRFALPLFLSFFSFFILKTIHNLYNKSTLFNAKRFPFCSLLFLLLY